MLFNRILVLLTLVSLLFASCSKDEMTVVGNWEFTQIETTNCTETSENGSLNLTDGCGTIDLVIFEVEVCGDAVFTDSNYTISNNTTVVGEETESDVDTGTYSIDGDKITFTSSVDSELTEGTINGDRNNMVISWEDEDSGCVTTITLAKK